ncbi:MAG: GNAT family N-acetyltransferase [Clostridia bacterium]|nr:GNAT family N-acetyltransferase [Clostridia bacterium]
MNLKDYVQQRMEEENRALVNSDFSFRSPKTAGEIVDFYRTYRGLTRQMRPLNDQQVEEYLSKGYQFIGAYYNDRLTGISVSKEFPEGYPYFYLPKDEVQGRVSTLGGLYVSPEFGGLGLASRLSSITTQATEQYGKNEPGAPVGMAYEVSYDNPGSLKILNRLGNFVGYYSDSDSKEGLSLLLYRPFIQQPVTVESPSIVLTRDEQDSQISVTSGFQQIATQSQIGGFETYTHQFEDGSVATTNILNKTPNTIDDPAITIEQ